MFTDRDIEPSHAWNQVKIDGNWYNTDLTWDVDDIKLGMIPKYCLKSDAEFKGHEKYKYRKNCEKCDKSFDDKKIRKAFPNKLDKIKQSVETIMQNRKMKESEEPIKEDRTDTSKALVKYQPSRLSKMFNAIVNKMRSFFNKFSNKKEKNPETEEVIETNSEKISFWDLRNWSPEELQTFAAMPPPQDHIQDKMEEEEKE